MVFCRGVREDRRAGVWLLDDAAAGIWRGLRREAAMGFTSVVLLGSMRGLIWNGMGGECVGVRGSGPDVWLVGGVARVGASGII